MSPRPVYPTRSSTGDVYRLSWLHDKSTVSPRPAYYTRSSTGEIPTLDSRPSWPRTRPSLSDQESYVIRPMMEDTPSPPGISASQSHDAKFSRSSSPTLLEYDEHSATVERYEATFRALPDDATITRFRAAHSALCAAARSKLYIHLFDELLRRLRNVPTRAEVDEMREIWRVKIVKDAQGRSATRLRQEVRAMKDAIEMWKDIGTKEQWLEVTVEARNAVEAMSRL